MQNLRDQLLKAGLITEDQRKKAEHDPRRGRPNDKRKARAPEEAKAEQPAADQVEAKKSQPQKPSKKQLAKQPMNRMIDLSDPRVLKIFQAIEEHRVREETKGEIPFHFTLRDGRVRKIFVTQDIASGLEQGRLAIVESGEENRHVIVQSGAVSLIREADPEAIRFFN